MRSTDVENRVTKRHNIFPSRIQGQRWCWSLTITRSALPGRRAGLALDMKVIAVVLCTACTSQTCLRPDILCRNV